MQDGNQEMSEFLTVSRLVEVNEQPPQLKTNIYLSEYNKLHIFRPSWHKHCLMFSKPLEGER